MIRSSRITSIKSEIAQREKQTLPQFACPPLQLLLGRAEERFEAGNLEKRTHSAEKREYRG